jgi:hypothetical protein
MQVNLTESVHRLWSLDSAFPHRLRDRDCVAVEVLHFETELEHTGLYTSHSFDHQGKLVATERIKWFLGPKTSIYEKGDIPDFILNQPTISIGDVVDRLYDVRNYIAHGDIISQGLLCYNHA